MIGLALRIIVHQPLRFVVALLGISVAAGLAFIQLGLYLGFKENASIIVDHTAADLWVCAPYHDNFDFPDLLKPRVLDLVRSKRGVKAAEPVLIVFAKWRRASAPDETGQIIGYNVERGLGRPWEMIRGFPEDLDRPGAITVDTTAQERLDGADVGSAAEIGGVTAHVVGLTRDIQSFQGNPVIFTSLDNARAFGHLPADAIHYIAVQLEPGADRAEVLDSLRGIGSCDAFTREDFSREAQEYWLSSTGAGTALALAAAMGLVVGVVVAGQVLYTSTLEHLREYGTLKAMGASNLQVTGAIVTQAVIGALPAHLLGGALLLLAARHIGGMGVHVSLDLPTYCWLGLGTVLICVTASLLSVWKVMRVEPAEVFKG